jgi:hypothetical protein
MKPGYSKAFLDLCASVTDKRPKTVIDHILEHGQITTEELKTLYGYNHPPRAARDVREKGIPLETFQVIGTTGRKIAAYRFASLEKMTLRRMAGRTNLSKKIRDELIAVHGSCCFIYQEQMDARELQIDHRIPYEIAGDVDEPRCEDFMLLCASANRAKSWSCEHCENWLNLKDIDVCQGCYWAFPECYEHVALRQVRRLDLMWQGSEVQDYENLRQSASARGKALPDFVKELLVKTLARKDQTS